MSIEEIENYVNKWLLIGRSMKDIEKNDFNANERVITKRLCRKVNGQFALQCGSKVVTNDLGLKLYSSNDKPVAKTIRLYQDIWDKLDKCKEKFPLYKLSNFIE